MGSLEGMGMALRAIGGLSVLLIAVAGAPGLASAQLLPPLQQLLPLPFRPPVAVPPAAVEDDPPYEVAPRQAPYGRPRKVSREDLPPPGYEPAPRYRGPTYGAPPAGAPPAAAGPGYDSDPRYRGPSYGAPPPTAGPNYDADPR